jgi:hypothetical protein
MLYAHAWRKRDALGLSEAERLLLKASLGHHLISIAIGLASVVVALVFPVRWSWLAGPLYFLMGPLHGVWGHRAGVRLERLQKSSAAVRVSVVVVSVAMSAPAAAQPAQTPQTPRQRLDTSLERITLSVNATWGIYAKSLETGEEIAIDSDRQMDTMSVIKIPLMVEVFQQIKEKTRTR